MRARTPVMRKMDARTIWALVAQSIGLVVFIIAMRSDYTQTRIDIAAIKADVKDVQTTVNNSAAPSAVNAARLSILEAQVQDLSRRIK